MYQDQQEARRAAIRRAAKASAKARTCPECGRGGALSHHVDQTGYLGSVTTCRWCPYERTNPPLLGD